MAAAPHVETLHPRCSCCCMQCAWLVRCRRRPPAAHLPPTCLPPTCPPPACTPHAPHPPAHKPSSATTPRRAQDVGGGGGQPGAGVGLVGLCSTVRGLLRDVGGARGRAAHLRQGRRVRFDIYAHILRIISPASVQNKLQVRLRAAVAASPAQREPIAAMPPPMLSSRRRHPQPTCHLLLPRPAAATGAGGRRAPTRVARTLRPARSCGW